MSTTDKRPLKVFLCHSSTDKPKVRELYRYLKRRGINPWFDEEHLVGGQDWQVEIPKALATSDAIIICLTKNSVDKEGYIQKEIKFALDKALEMPEGRIFLIPVKFEECEVPFTLSRYQWVDLTVEAGYAKMMKALKFRASQLERSTVEITRKDVEEENLAREKKERESAERERKEKEFSEKQAREVREKEKRKTEKKEEKPTTIKPKSGVQIAYWAGGFIVLVLGIIFLSSLNNTPSTPQLTPENTQMQAIATLTQDTTESSATLTPKLTSTPANTLTPTPLPTEITDAKGVSMMLVPSGNFIMGSDSGDEEEKPFHQVYLDAFYIDAYEVTNILYKACVDIGECKKPNQSRSRTHQIYYGNPQFDNYPVIYVDWNMAKTYCEWRGGRLPAEAEWEKAARGTEGRNYPWGNDYNRDYANYYINVGDTTSVGKYESDKSPYGVYDMAGNVSEWVSSLYRPYPYSITDGREDLSSDGNRVARGDDWLYPISEGSSVKRIWLPKLSDGEWLGFRCARDVNP